MYVCICNAVTDRQIRRAAAAGASDLWTLQRELGVAAGCGSCKEHAMSVLAEASADSQFEPVLFSPGAA